MGTSKWLREWERDKECYNGRVKKFIESIEGKKPKKKRNQHQKDYKHIPYEEQMKSRKWFTFRAKVLRIKGSRCQSCGSSQNLQVHHNKYRPRTYAWNYPVSQMTVLCRECHKFAHGIIDNPEFNRLIESE